MSVPTAPLLPHIERYLLSNPEMGHKGLAERAGCDEAVIRRIIDGITKRVEFPTADRIVCALGDPCVWYHDYGDLYWKHPLPEVKKGESRCAHKGCMNPVPPKTHNGGRPRRFCSKNCQMREWERLHPRTDRPHKSGEQRSIASRRYSKCPQGHDRSPENTGHYKTKKGTVTIYCRVCQREKARERRAA